MSQRKTLVYFGHLPVEGAGSAIIVLRHLRRLKEAGWKIHIVGDWGQSESVCLAEGWTVHYLPHRRRWWPPYRVRWALTARLRHWLWASEARRLLANVEPNVVLTYLSAFSDTLSQVAAVYARRCGMPLTTLVHDDCRAFIGDSSTATQRWKRYRWVLESASQNWFVSPELAAAYGFQNSEENNVLAPLGEGLSLDSPEFPPPKPPLFVYAGNARAPQVPVLEEMSKTLASDGMRLLVISETTEELEAAVLRSPLEWRAPFLENRQALAWIRENATAILIVYAASNAQPWVRSSFPSKLIEFVHLGLPVLIAAPPDSAVAHWARRAGWTDLISPDDAEGLHAFARAITDKEQWHAKGLRALSVATKYFDPLDIQSRFVDRLIPTRDGQFAPAD